MVKQSIIITAGGAGVRMGTGIPKQFLELKGKPVLMHTIALFYRYNQKIEIILVLPSNQLEFWEGLCKTHAFDIRHQVVVGGKERFDSVKNGLEYCTGSVVGVHDAVRPLVSLAVIKKCFDTAVESHAVIPVVEVKESIRMLEGDASRALDRSKYRIVQTPQCFSFNVLRQAYNQQYDPCFTDDASVVENSGVTVLLIPGNPENIKITTPIDLRLAELLMA